MNILVFRITKTGTIGETSIKISYSSYSMRRHVIFYTFNFKLKNYESVFIRQNEVLKNLRVENEMYIRKLNEKQKQLLFYKKKN